MNHAIESAVSGRAKCPGCGRNIAKGEMRLGERLPNPYADEGDMVLWFHLSCGAFKRPEVLLEALQRTTTEVEDRQRLSETARLGIAHRRLTRVDGVQRSPTGRARCRSCRESIPKDTWCIALVYYEDGRFDPGGFAHLACAEGYLGTEDIIDRLTHFTNGLSADDIAEIRTVEP